MIQKPQVPLGKQIMLLLEGLSKINANVKDERYLKTVEYVRDLPQHVRMPELYTAVARAFGTTVQIVEHAVDPSFVKLQREFDELVPKEGWLRDYIEYTRFTEPPTVFHFFIGCVVLGCTLKRHVFFDKGYAPLIPAMCVILVAPSGKCRKTSACELGVSILRDSGSFVLADKLTPEVMTVAFEERPAQGLIYAGELKQFLGSQKYMEGMIPLLTRLLEQPARWTSATIGRGETELRDVALSFLGATTMDWMRQLPTDSFGGGFMSRFLFILQEDTPRSFPLPPPLDPTRKAKLVNTLVKLTHVRRKMTMTPNADAWYRDWYTRRSDLGTEEKQFSGYYERKPDHVIRLAMLLSISEDHECVVEVKHMKHALEILNWIEAWLPTAFEQLAQTNVGADTHRMLDQLKKTGGSLKHSDWLRKNSHRMRVDHFRQHIETLRSAGLVDFDPVNKMYYLTPEGWKA
jgi:hypothetical protein